MHLNDELILRANGDAMTARISDRWMVGQGPNGGYLSALALAAARTVETDPTRPLRSFNIQFIGRLVPGDDADITATARRQGGAMSVVDVTIGQRDRTAVLARCMFLTAKDGPEFFEHPAPDVPSPEELGPYHHDVEDNSIRRRYDTRYAVGGFPPDVSDRAEVTGWIRPESGEPIGEAMLLAISDGWAPPILLLPGAEHVATTVDLQVLMRSTSVGPIDDYVLARTTTRTMTEGYVEQDTDVWTRDGTLLCQARQLGLLIPWQGA